MQPLVKQHLESLRKTLTEVVMPELGGNPFALEQAGLIAASLALLAEVQPYEDDYLHQELTDLRALLALCGDDTPLPEPQGRDQLAGAVAQAKRQLDQRLQAQTGADGRLPAPLREALWPLLERQLAREASWSRLTGFNPAGASLPPIGALLAQQRSPS